MENQGKHQTRRDAGLSLTNGPDVDSLSQDLAMIATPGHL